MPEAGIHAGFSDRDGLSRKNVRSLRQLFRLPQAPEIWFQKRKTACRKRKPLHTSDIHVNSQCHKRDGDLRLRVVA